MLLTIDHFWIVWHPGIQYLFSFSVDVTKHIIICTQKRFVHVHSKIRSLKVKKTQASFISCSFISTTIEALSKYVENWTHALRHRSFSSLTKEHFYWLVFDLLVNYHISVITLSLRQLNELFICYTGIHSFVTF